MKLIKHLKVAYMLSSHFGIVFGVTYLIEKINVGKLSHKFMKIRMRKTKEWLVKKYSHLLKTENTYKTKNNRVVWVYWGQGEDNAPELVHACINSMRKNINCEVIVITNNNFSDYVKLDDAILSKFKKGIITYTHFSDILRCELLKTQGGLWLDSTVLVTGFDPKIWERKFWTVRRNENREIGSISYYRWNNAILKGDSDIYFYMSILFREYWKENDEMIDYFLIDYFMDMIFDYCPMCKKVVNSVPFNNEREFELMSIMNKEYDENQFNNLVEECFVHKLQRRKSLYKKTKEGKDTFYSFIIKKYIM